MPIKNRFADLQNEMVSWRHDFHEYPELQFDLPRTTKKITELLKGFGVDSIKREVGKSGIVAEIYGQKIDSGKAIGFRADMDALPIHEDSKLSFRSLNDGVMHACGHDGHMAILLGVAQALSKNTKLKKGTVRFIFQPAEEGLGGARYMIKDGCLKGVDEIYGLHLWNYQRYGEVGVKTGPVMASADLFDIEVMGKGGHGATPQGTVDPIVVASNLITQLQTIVSRNTNPLESTVISIGKINGGHNFNVISDHVTMSGTTRSSVSYTHLTLPTKRIV